MKKTTTPEQKGNCTNPSQRGSTEIRTGTGTLTKRTRQADTHWVMENMWEERVRGKTIRTQAGSAAEERASQLHDTAGEMNFTIKQKKVMRQTRPGYT